MTMPPSSRAERAGLITGAAALALVLGALGFQYIKGLGPCEMCQWQRWPHMAAALLGLCGTPLIARHPAAARILVGVTIAAGLILAGLWGLLAGWQPPLLLAVIILLCAWPVWQADPRRIAIAVIGLVTLSGLIGVYQTGLQWGFLPGPSACTAHRFIVGSTASAPEARCDIPTWFLFGLALPAYNAIFSFLIAGAGAMLLKGRSHAA
jgi:disulfide bond formation protein DsbB